MTEVLVQFDTPVRDPDGRAYTARISGREVDGGMWEGWIEFEPDDGGEPLRSPRETTQPNRADLDYWASGLTVAYLEGALARAHDPETPDLRPVQVSSRPTFDAPAPRGPASAPASSSTQSSSVLDPFDVYRQGEDLLREELSALDEGHLRNIIRAHSLADPDEVDLRAMSRAGLADLIVAAVRQRAS